MFSAINKLLNPDSEVTLKITQAPNGKLKVRVIPAPGKGQVDALASPIMLSGTPEELDQGFMAAISQYVDARITLEDQISATTALLKAETQKQSNKAVKALSGSGDTSSVSAESMDDEEAEDSREDAGNLSAGKKDV